MPTRFTIKTPNFSAGLARDAAKYNQLQLRAARQGTDQISKIAQANIQGAIRSAGLKNLANAVGQTSALKKGQSGAYGAIYARGGDNSSGGGTLDAYSNGATITAANGTWLAITTPVVPKYVAGHRRMTPELYVQLGYAQRIGKLHFIPVSASEAVLVANNVAQHVRTGRIKARGKNRSKVNVNQASVVVFVLIRQTVRSRRFDKDAECQRAADRAPEIMAAIFDSAT